MNRAFQLAIAIVFVGMVVGIGNGIGRHGFSPFTIAIVAIVMGCFVSIVKTVSRRDDADDHPREDRRLAELETRITDLQDIVLSMDEKLQRLTDTTTKQTNTSSD